VNRWQNTIEPQRMLPAVAACAFATTRQVSEDRHSKPEQGRRD
jgi:hypothetical protein